MHPIVRLVGIMGVFVLAAAAWLILGAVTGSRTSEQKGTLEGRVADLWGSPQTQLAPIFELQWMEQETKTEQIIDATGRTSTKKTIESVARSKLVDPMRSRLAVDLHAEFHSARDQRDLARRHVDPSEFGRQLQDSQLRNDEQLAVGIDEHAPLHRLACAKLMDRNALEIGRIAIGQHGHHAVYEVGSGRQIGKRAASSRPCARGSSATAASQKRRIISILPL